MTMTGLDQARAKMRAAGVDEVATATFADHYVHLQRGETGMIPESSIEPLEMESLSDVRVDDAVAAEAIGATVVIKLNGGLGTSMGMDRAKSLLEIGGGLTFLDVIAQQVLHQREQYGARLPLLLMNSFRTSADSLEALERYPDLPVGDLPLEFLQSKEPKLRADDLTPVDWPADPELEWCPPGHADIYPALRSSGLLDRLIADGYRYAFVSNSDNLGAIPDARVAGWFAESGAPLAIEAVRRTASDRKGGHFARRRSDGAIVLRETAQTLPEDRVALADLTRHQYCSTNNLWLDLAALRDVLDEHDGVLGLPMIANHKTVDPSDPSSPAVIQLESAMGSAIEVFPNARTIAVGRDRFVPVKTTDDLLVLRSDVYALSPEAALHLVSDAVPFVELDRRHFRLIDDFDERFPDGVPSLRDATSFTVIGDVHFGAGVRVHGAAVVDAVDGTRVAENSDLGDAAHSSVTPDDVATDLPRAAG
ncbi:UTP--glucose-1-phosphate uridylyltransferase [Microbacterium gorillae]|uniref:UTP--glucose-1-phosphate uridylyltransferase n=1 Tax=Microbacterium gorillae TaxID=1231063 RepID=UPI000A98159A|nr:UTP--glucose-1-phosphate uridylyltransferase [Microbacterium gorillae]